MLPGVSDDCPATSATAIRRARDLGLCAGQSSAPGVERVFKLSSNETPLGASPKAVEAYRAAADICTTILTVRRPRCAKRSARVYGLDPNRIICGAAPTNCSTCWRMAFSGRGDEAIHTSMAFSSTTSRR